MNNQYKVTDVIEGLRCCLAHSKNRCIKCPYCNVYGGFRTCIGDLMIDALSALESQEEKGEGNERMKRDELIKQVRSCSNSALCFQCNYVNKCRGITAMLEDILEYLEHEQKTEVKEKRGGGSQIKRRMRND